MDKELNLYKKGAMCMSQPTWLAVTSNYAAFLSK